MPAFAVIGDVYRGNAARFGDKLAFIMPDGRTRSFAQLHQRALRLCGALYARGLKASDRVGILSRNRIEYIEGYGVSGAGLIALPLNWRLSPRELQTILLDAQPAAILVDATFAPVIAGMREALPFLRHVIGFDDDYEAMLADGAPESLSTAVSPEDTACLLYTSGTTGSPKGAELTHRGLLLNCEGAMREMFGFSDADVTLAPMPFFHVGGMWYHLFPSFAAGCTSVILPQFDPQAVLELMARYGVTNTHLVPTMIHAVLEQENLKSFDLSALRLMFYAASTMPLDTLRRATQTFDCEFAQGYGSTEAGAVTCLTPQDHKRAEAGRSELLLSCGRRLKGVEVRIAAPENSGHDEIGEILVRSPMTMARYWRNVEATGRALEDGWLHTGDLGRLDEEGYLYILDRKSDMIVTGGENVYPREVEDVLLEDPDIAEVAVFDLPDPRWVQRVVAAVVPRGNAEADAILSRVKARLAGYKCPKQIFITDALPKNGAGKVLRKTLREIYRVQEPAET